MQNKNILLFIKIIHTLLWIILIFFIGYIWYSIIFNKMNFLLWISVVFVIGEGVILLTFNRKCPLSYLAAKYTNNHEPGFDILLPKWLAKYNIPLFSLVATIGIIIIAIKYITKHL